MAMLPLGDGRIKLLDSIVEDLTVGRFLAKRGEGLRPIAVGLANVDERFERLREEGVRLVSDGVEIGAGGHRYFHPDSSGGVLVEVVGKAASRESAR